MEPQERLTAAEALIAVGGLGKEVEAALEESLDPVVQEYMKNRKV